MKFKLRDYWQFILILIICLILGILVLVAYAGGQEREEPKPPPWECWYDSLEMVMLKQKLAEQERVPIKMPPPYPSTEAEEKKPVKTWKLPDYMRENLQRELDDFNKRFEAKVQVYKKELKTRFKEFADMPEDVILYLEGGFFITRSDFLKLQEQLRDKLKKEVKGDDKTTN